MPSYVASPTGTVVRATDGQLVYLGAGTPLPGYVTGAQLAELIANGRVVDAADAAVDPTPTPDPGVDPSGTYVELPGEAVPAGALALTDGDGGIEYQTPAPVTAADIPFVPGGGIAASNLQAAVEEAAADGKTWLDRKPRSVADPLQAAGTKTIGTANRGYYMRGRGAGVISGVYVHIAAQVGNICIAVYSDNGSGAPGELKASTGSIACPTTGSKQVALPCTVEDGDWFYLGGDTTTTAFRAFTASSLLTGLATGICGYRDADFPASASGGVANWDIAAAIPMVGY